MGYREYIDSVGISWKVWNTVPLAGAVLRGDMRDGWLTFASSSRAVRRLAPTPHNWEELTSEQLEQLCAQAAEVQNTAPGDTVTFGPASPNDSLRLPKSESNPNH